MSDYTLADTIYIMFTTRSFSTGAPTVLAGTPAVSAYENESVTQITAGVTLGVDHDSVVGLNLLTIVATGANGYEAGKDYHMVITTGTVGGVSVVGEVVGRFTLQRSAAAVDLANGTDGLGAIKAETAAILVDTAEIGAAGAGLTAINLPDQTMNITGDITGNLSGSVGSVTGAVSSVTGNVGGNVVGTVAGVTPSTAAQVAAVLTTQITESYRANAAAPTLAQFISEVLAHLGEVGISGVTKTINKFDHVTSAATFTLDSATDPATITRAT